MTETKKTTYIISSAYALIGRTGSPTDSVGPNERVEFDESADSHKYLKERIEAGDPTYSHLSILEVDLKAEAGQEEEKQDMLAKAAEIAAEERNKEAQEASERLDKQAELRDQAQEEGQPPVNEGTDYPPQDVEAQKLAEQSGAGQRASTQEDVVEESKGTGRKRSSKG